MGIFIHLLLMLKLVLDRQNAVFSEDISEETTCNDPGFIFFGLRTDTYGCYLWGEQTFQVGQSVVYSCLESEVFFLLGYSVLTCMQNGNWSNPRPRCIRHTGSNICRHPETPKHGFIRCFPAKELFISSYYHQPYCIAWCETGYRFNDAQSRYAIILICNESGYWTPLPSFPDCKLIPTRTCRDPGFISNGLRTNTDGSTSSTNDNFKQGEWVHYNCTSKEFSLNGTSYITCNQDGSWSSPLPECIRIPTTIAPEPTCPDPGQVKYAYRLNSDGSPSPEVSQPYEVGQSVEYKCHQGWFLWPHHGTITCLDSGQWSSEKPFCVGKTIESSQWEYCMYPGGILNGQVVYVPPVLSQNSSNNDQEFQDEYRVGSQLQYSCGLGYTLEGLATLTCEKSGSWSPEIPPTCRNVEDNNRVYCDNPGRVFNGSVWYFAPGFPSGSGMRLRNELPEYPEGSMLEYYCDEDYLLQGPEILTCKSGGNWSAEIPKCIEANPYVMKYCRDPGTIPNGSRNPPMSPDLQFLIGSRIDYYCDHRYELIGVRTIFCLIAGAWSSPQPECKVEPDSSQLENCMYPGDILNGQVVYVNPVPSQDSSNNDEELEDDYQVRSHNDEEPEDEYQVGSQLEYSCGHGYTLEGLATLTCEKSGSWSPEIPPTCRNVEDKNPMYCDNPGRVFNAIVWYFAPGYRHGSGVRLKNELPEYPEGSMLEYACEENYLIQGPNSLTCESEGNWSAEIPQCIEACGRTFARANVRIRNGKESVYGGWPWMVSISIREGNGSKFICGGAIMNSHSVITAAHCLESRGEYILRFGKHHFEIEDDDPSVLIRTNTRVLIHPDYSSRTMDSDIALILFEPPIKYSYNVQPICLPTIETTMRNIIQGRKGYISGWGDTEYELQADRLLFAGLPILSTRDCVESYADQNLTVAITPNMFCAGFYNGTYSVCSGDSGSPFVIYDQRTERYTMEGVVSFVLRKLRDAQLCGLPGRYAVFTRVYRFVPWIIEQIE